MRLDGDSVLAQAETLFNNNDYDGSKFQAGNACFIAEGRCAPNHIHESEPIQRRTVHEHRPIDRGPPERVNDGPLTTGGRPPSNTPRRQLFRTGVALSLFNSGAQVCSPRGVNAIAKRILQLYAFIPNILSLPILLRWLRSRSGGAAVGDRHD